METTISNLQVGDEFLTVIDAEGQVALVKVTDVQPHVTGWKRIHLDAYGFGPRSFWAEDSTVIELVSRDGEVLA